MQVRRKGYRSVTKTFGTKEAAEAWAEEIERRIEVERDGSDYQVLPDDIRYLPRIDAKNGAVGVYFLFRGDDCIYVGQSKNVHTRVREHRLGRNGSKDFDTYSWLPVPEEKLDQAELHYIETLMPPLNVMGGEAKRLMRRMARDSCGVIERRRIEKRLLQICHADS